MDVTSVGALVGSIAVETKATASNVFLSPEEAFSATDPQLMALATKWNIQAILELEKRDAALAARQTPSTPQVVFPVAGEAIGNLVDTFL